MKERKQPTRLCPFKKIVEREYNSKTGNRSFNERFAPCAGEWCMAYYRFGGKGMCRRLETEKGR